MIDKDSLPYRPCVGVMLLDRTGRVFIGKRNALHGVETGYDWQMPQGGIDPGEDPLVAATRELYEETSIRSVTPIAEAPDWYCYDFPPDILERTRKGKYRGQAQKWYAFRFDGDETEIDVLNPPGDHEPEFTEWRWERADVLPDLIIPFKRDVYREVIAAFAHLTRGD